MTIISSTQEWDQFVDSEANAHILQTSAWGQFKSHFGWKPVCLKNDSCGAQVLFRQLPLGFSIAYIPKGPIGENWLSLLPELDKECKRHKAIMLIIEPDSWAPLSDDLHKQLGQYYSIEEHTIQPRRTILIDISGDEEDILAKMKQKTRYNIRLAERKDVIVSETGDIQAFYKMMGTTGERDGFAVHNLSYYEQVYAQFAPLGQCALLQASFENTPIAALMVFAFKKQAWYFYGASTDQERQRMPTYLLQWEAIRWAKSKGCTTYDLWGIPDFDEDYLEENFSKKSDGLWGVYRFKRGFGGQVVRSAPAYVRVYKPLLHLVYRWLTKRQPGGQA